jgi:drug/metabolite transporter (DMT)-like permease
MAVVVKARGGSMRVSRRALLSCILIGALLPGANAVLFYAEENVPTGLASLLIASVPLWVVLLRLISRERMSTMTLAGVGVGFLGVAILVQPEGNATAAGIGLCLLSAVLWSIGSFASARLEMPENPFTATSLEMLAGGLMMLPIGIWQAGSLSPSNSSILAWVYLVAVGSVVGYTAYTWLHVNAPLGLVSTYAYVNPVVALLLGLLFRNEQITTRILIGAAIVVSAVAVVVRQEPPSSAPIEENVH